MTWNCQVNVSTMMLMDMIAAALTFLLVTALYWVRQTVVRSLPPENLLRFILVKESVARPTEIFGAEGQSFGEANDVPRVTLS